MNTVRVDRERLLTEFHGNAPADPATVERFLAESRVRVPDDYVTFVRQVNGGEGFIGPNA
jgi:hypothetical protein